MDNISSEINAMVNTRGSASYINRMKDDVKLDWRALKEAGAALGIDPSTWPPMDDAPISVSPDRQAHEPDDVTDSEWAAIQHVLPADCGSDRRDTISVALFITGTGRPWS